VLPASVTCSDGESQSSAASRGHGPRTTLSASGSSTSTPKCLHRNLKPIRAACGAKACRWPAGARSPAPLSAHPRALLRTGTRRPCGAALQRSRRRACMHACCARGRRQASRAEPSGAACLYLPAPTPGGRPCSPGTRHAAARAPAMPLGAGGRSPSPPPCLAMGRCSVGDRTRSLSGLLRGVPNEG